MPPVAYIQFVLWLGGAESWKMRESVSTNQVWSQGNCVKTMKEVGDSGEVEACEALYEVLLESPVSLWVLSR